MIIYLGPNEPSRDNKVKFPEFDPPRIEGRCRWCGEPFRRNTDACECYVQCGDPEELKLVFDSFEEDPINSLLSPVLGSMTDPNGVERAEQLLTDFAYRPPLTPQMVEYAKVTGQTPDFTDLPQYMKAAIKGLANVADPRSAETMGRAFQYLVDNPQLRQMKGHWVFDISNDVFRYWAGIDDKDRLAEVIRTGSVWSWGAAVILAATGDDRAFPVMNAALRTVTPDRPEGWVNPIDTALSLNAPELLESLKVAFLDTCADLHTFADLMLPFFAMARYFDQLGEPGVATLDEARSIRGNSILPEPSAKQSTTLKSLEAFKLTYDLAAESDDSTGTKFGGQPDWRDEPTWPLDAGGDPMSFWCQIEFPWDPSKMAYLFVSLREDDMKQSDDGTASLLIQPGGIPAEPHKPMATGPVVRNEAERLRPFVPRIPSLTPFQDLISDDTEFDRPEETWDKVGGHEHRLHGTSTRGPGWRFLFQFAADSAGREIAGGAHCYGWVHEDGRGWFDWDCH